MTAQDIIKRARRLIGSLGRGEIPSHDENSDDLQALNGLLDILWAQRLAVYRTQEESLTVTAQTHTLGPSGDTVTTRPIKVESAVQRSSGTDWPIDILTEQQYRMLAVKTTQSSIVSNLWYDPTPTNGTLYFYPVPSASITVLLRTRARIENFTINETVALPPGYEDMLAYQLALRIAPEYQRQVPQEVARAASTTLRALKAINARPAMTRDAANGRYSVFADG